MLEGSANCARFGGSTQLRAVVVDELEHATSNSHPLRMTGLAVRWTIGDVSDQGFEALRLSVWGAWRLFGEGASYTVCLNTVPLALARAKAGALPDAVAWREVGRHDIPRFLRDRLDAGMAEGVGWKFAPLQLDAGRPELALDNDCILWGLPEALHAWLTHPEPAATLMAEDVRGCFGRFSSVCAPIPRNSGIRGLPAGFDLGAALADVLRRHDGPLTSELDEQGLQVAALEREGRMHVVSVDDVAITSPFPPHLPSLGRTGAHFVGLNRRSVDWQVDGRPADAHIREHWGRLAPEIYARVGISPQRATRAA